MYIVADTDQYSPDLFDRFGRSEHQLDLCDPERHPRAKSVRRYRFVEIALQVSVQTMLEWFWRWSLWRGRRRRQLLNGIGYVRL